MVEGALALLRVLHVPSHTSGLPQLARAARAGLLSRVEAKRLQLLAGEHQGAQQLGCRRGNAAGGRT